MNRRILSASVGAFALAAMAIPLAIAAQQTGQQLGQQAERTVAPLAAPAPGSPEAARVGAVNTAFLLGVDDVSAVTQLVLRERQARDRGWWAQMRSTYWPDGRVDLAWYHGNAAGFIDGSEQHFGRGDRVSHRMFAPVVDIRGRKAHVEVAALTWSTNRVKGVEANFNTSMRLNYRLEKRGREWRILSLNVIYEYSEVKPAMPNDRIDMPSAELARYRKSYAALSWTRAQAGVELDQNELGVDRPEEVQRFYDSIKAWLNS